MTQVKCALGDHEIDTTEPNVFVRSTGWREINRKGGGSNSLREHKDHEEWCCKWCLELESKRKGWMVSAKQGDLF